MEGTEPMTFEVDSNKYREISDRLGAISSPVPKDVETLNLKPTFEWDRSRFN